GSPKCCWLYRRWASGVSFTKRKDCSTEMSAARGRTLPLKYARDGECHYSCSKYGRLLASGHRKREVPNLRGLGPSCRRRWFNRLHATGSGSIPVRFPHLVLA